MAADPRARVQVLPRAPRLVDEVVSRLRDSVIDGTFPAGTRLPQVALAEQLGVSRTPLREALRVLENEGLLRTADGNRTVEVVPVSAEDLREMYELREVIDGLAARLAAAKGFTPAEEETAWRLLEMAESTEPHDPVQRNRSHAALHELIAQASDNAKLQSFASLIRTSSTVLYFPLQRENVRANLAAADPRRSYEEILDESQDQHREIIEAIVARNPDEAEAAARRHIQRTLSLAPYFD